MDAKAVEYDLTCTKCRVRFKMMSATGPSNICDACTLPMLEAIYGEPLRWNVKFGIVEVVGGSSEG